MRSRPLKRPCVDTCGSRAGALLIRFGVILFWVGSMALLVRYEAFPEFFSHQLDGYRSLLESDVVLRDDWMQLRYEDTPMGYSHTTVETYESDPLRFYTVRNKVFMRLRLMGTDQSIFVDTRAHVDVSHNLQSFVFSFASEDYRAEVRAQRQDRSQFSVRMKTGGFVQQSVVTIPDDVILYSPMTEMAMRDLRRGQTLTIKTLDPATMTPATLLVTSTGEETIRVGGARYVANRLISKIHGTELQTWIGADGKLLRQETPLGWTLERCTAEDAMKILSSRQAGVDLLDDLSVPVRGQIKAPRTATRLLLHLQGSHLVGDDIQTGRQHLRATTARGLLLELEPSSFPLKADPLPAEAVAEHLASTAFIQSGHEEIQRAATRITRGASTPRERAERIFAWVYENVDKEIYVSLPSAVDVLRDMKGDCNEHTYLFVALARAAGLPAKVIVGLAYQEGAFYYHAWPAVYLGGWVEMDPTWGQPLVDATHIAITEGELEHQFDLLKVLGRLVIDVEEEQ